MPIMIAATATCGLAAALGYRGSLQVVNQIAPREQRAEVRFQLFRLRVLRQRAAGHRRRHSFNADEPGRGKHGLCSRDRLFRRRGAGLRLQARALA
jgi:hypothetical protein